MAPKRILVDPDPASIISATDCILSAVDLALRIYDYFKPTGNAKRIQAIYDSMDEIGDQLGYLQQDMKIIQEIVEGAQFSGGRQFRLGREAFLTQGEFRRWERTTSDLMARLKNLVAFTNRVSRLLAPLGVRDQSFDTIPGLRSEIDRVLNDKDQTIDEAIRRLLSVISDLRALELTARSHRHLQNR